MPDIADLPDHLIDVYRKMASPAHIAQYVTRDMPPETQWKPYAHLMVINRKLVEAATAPEQRFLNLAVSVRMGKSELISRYLPVWYLGLFPDRQVIIVSYNEAKAAEWGEFTRNVMQEFGNELFGITVDKGSASKTDWKIAGRRGGLRAVGVGGGLTGIGGDLICIDDPLKNREEADSPANQRNIWSWYGSTLRTRLMPGGTMIMAMARWNVSDLTGMIEKMAGLGGDDWEFVNMPALAEAPKGAGPTWRDELGRAEGEALWPEVWPVKLLEQIRASIGPSDWNSLYQQHPSLPEGGMFRVDDWQRRPYVDKRTLRLCRVWDLAATEGGGDWTAGVLIGMDSRFTTYVLDLQHFQRESAGVQAAVRATAEADGKAVPIRIEQERAGAGKAQIADYVRLLVGFDVAGIKPEGSKESRAAPFATQQQNRNVFLVDGPWTTAFIEEHRVFPNGRHDDICDAAAEGFNFLASGGETVLIAEEILGIPLAQMWQARELRTTMW